jgi:hypothetical protein
MKVGQIKEILLSEPHTEKVYFNNNEPGDMVTDELYIELENDCQVTALAYGLRASKGVPVKFIDIANLTTCDVIDKAGLYMVMTSALERLDITFNAQDSIDGSTTCKAIIKTVYGG